MKVGRQDAGCRPLVLTSAALPVQSRQGIRVLVAGTENILDNLYFGALP